MKWPAGLFKHLGERLERGPCDNTMRFATLLDSDECNDCEEALEWLAERGGSCDCEVPLNVEMESVRRFRTLERRWAGRISCRALDRAFGSQRRFLAFRARHPVLNIAAGHSQSEARCRQWTLAPRAVRSVRVLMDSPVLLFMLCGAGGRVIYSETHRRNSRRKRRISAVHLAREAHRTLESVTGTVAAREPPPEALKTSENAMFGKPGSAAGARRHGKRAVAA